MREFIILLSFVPWLLFFLYKCKNTLKDLKNKRLTGEWIKKNLLNLFHFDNLILFGIFLFFCKTFKDSNQIFLTKVLLFSCINLYLFINQLYEKKHHKTVLGIEDISTILIIGSHASPLFHSVFLDYCYGQYFFRFCVPLFFLSSGYFFQKMTSDKRIKYIKRILIIYIVSSILYIPIVLYFDKSLIRAMLFGYRHLWYLIALFEGLVLCYFTNKYKIKHTLVIAIFLLIFGIFFYQ